MDEKKQHPVLAFARTPEEKAKKKRKGDGARRASRFISSYLTARAATRPQITCAEVFEAYMDQAEKPVSRKHFISALQDPDEFTGLPHFDIFHQNGESWVRLIT